MGFLIAESLRRPSLKASGFGVQTRVPEPSELAICLREYCGFRAWGLGMYWVFCLSKEDRRGCKRILRDPGTEKAALGHVRGDAVNGLVKVSTGSALLNDL